jgi:amino acid transporter
MTFELQSVGAAPELSHRTSPLREVNDNTNSSRTPHSHVVSNLMDDDTTADKNGTSFNHSDAPQETTRHHIDGGDANPNKLNSIMLATIVFYSVSGGPFGIEESIRAGGNFYTLLGFLILPFVWSIPEAVMTTELGAAFVDASGGVAWVEAAFGYSAGWMVGYLGWVAGATDNAIYPVLFLDYVLQGLLSGKSDPNDVASLHPFIRFVVLSGTSILLSYINWLGLPIVGRMSVIICCVAMSPFLLLTLIGMFSVDPSRWLQRPEDDILSHTDEAASVAGGFFPNFMIAGVLWRPFLNNLFWNLNSFDSAASFSEDVDDPGKAFPKAMTWAVLMVFTGYLFPLMVALGASDAKQSDWVDGYLATAASNIVGPWLGGWTVFAAGISNIALYQAELSTEAYQLMGMAERGYVPSLFAQRSRHGTPTYGIVLGTIVIIVLVTMSDLAQLIEMLNFNYAIALLMEYAAFVKLRITHPDLPRPWRLPFNTIGCVLLFIPPFICTTFLLMLATYETYVFSLVVIAIGMLLYLAKQRGYWGLSEVVLPQALPAHGTRKGSYNLVAADSSLQDGANGIITSDFDDDAESEIELSNGPFVID